MDDAYIRSQEHRYVPLMALTGSEIVDLQKDHNKAAGEAFVVIIAKLQAIAKKLEDIESRIGEL
jgi:hypothetical protein